MAIHNDNKDLLGREIKAGDLIAYGVPVGQASGIAIYRVIEVKVNQDRWDGRQYYRLFVRQLKTCSYSKNIKPSTLQFPERAIILGPEFEGLVSGV